MFGLERFKFPGGKRRKAWTGLSKFFRNSRTGLPKNIFQNYLMEEEILRKTFTS
jgi:hypothetical protein